jgi:hypothetical protein
MWDNLDSYWEALQASRLSDNSVEDYYYFAECYVRWLEGSFTPGARLEAQDERARRAHG